MVTQRSAPDPADDPKTPRVPDTEALEDLWQERIDQRARRRQARRRSKAGARRIVVDADRRTAPDSQRMSRALLALQRQLAAADAETDARSRGESDTASGGES